MSSFQDFPLRIAHHPAAGQLERERCRVLFVHDENPVPGILDDALKSAGYDLFTAWTVREALQTFHATQPDLILLELTRSDRGGKSLRRLRESITIPIVVISSQQDESEQICCLDSGADDYVTKPVTIARLLARLRAALRRAFGIPRSEVFKTGGLKVDFSMRAVFIWEEHVRLSATEYALLKVLASHAGMVKTHHQLIHEVWGTLQYQDAVHLLRVTVSNLRRKLVCDSRSIPLIVTEAGIGYRLRRDSEWTRELRLEPPVTAARMKNRTC